MATLPRIGDLLVEAGAITRDQLADALAHQRQHGGRLGTNLVELGFIDEKTVASLLARQLSIPSATAAQLERCDSFALKLVPAGVADRLRAVPVREDAGRLWVAMADPTDQVALAELARVTAKPVRPMVAPELLIQYALERHYKVARKLRVVEVRTGGSDLLTIDAPQTAKTAAGTLPPPAEPAPVWNTFGGAPRVNVDALAGYLDDEPQRPAASPGRMPMKEVSAQLVAAISDEAIFEVAQRYVAQDVKRLAVLLLRNGLLGGWRGVGVDNAQLRGINVALADAPVIARALASGEPWIGRLQAAELGALAAPLGASREALGVVLPVRIGKRAVGAVVGLDASLELLRHKPELARLAAKLDQALHISYLRRLLMQP